MEDLVDYLTQLDDQEANDYLLEYHPMAVVN